MNSKTARKFRRKLVTILLPTLAIAVGLLSIVAVSYWSKAKQSDKFALPADRCAKSVLAFLRRLDGEFDPRATWLSESNLLAINDAVREATEILDQNNSELSPVELREADYYRLYFGFQALFAEGIAEDSSEWDRLQSKTRRYVTEATQVSTREFLIATYALAGLEGSQRTDEAIELANLIEERFASLPDSQQQQTTLDLVASVRDRLQMLGTEIDLTTFALDGQAISLRDLRGKVVLVEFWSTTCGPCIADFPALKRIYSTYHDRGFEIFAICLHASAAKIETFTTEHELPWLQVCHDRIEGNDEWAKQFGIQAVPTTMLIDQTGKVLAFGIRPLHSHKERDLEVNLKRLFGH